MDQIVNGAEAVFHIMLDRRYPFDLLVGIEDGRLLHLFPLFAEQEIGFYAVVLADFVYDNPEYDSIND